MRKLLFLALLALVGCAPKVDESDLTMGNFYFFGARCDIYDGSSNLIACIEYSSLLSTTLASDCVSDRDMFGGANYNFTDAEGTPGCSAINRSGLCKNSEGRFHFYNSKYSAGAAQTECNSLGGSFE